MRKGEKGKIVGEVWISCEPSQSSEGIVSADEQIITEGSFTIKDVRKDFIIVNFDGDPTDWFIVEEDYDNLQIL
jgi:hypothetical protein